MGQSSTVVGKWQTKSGASKEIILTVAQKETLRGSLLLVNPKGTSSELPLVNPVLAGNVLNFRTVDQGTTMEWKLTISSRGKKARLQGFDRRPGKFGKDGEMSIGLKLYRTSS
jgi:hypothetical protein